MIEWDEVFETGIVPEGTTEEEAKGMAYSGWGCCLSGIGKLPENFGKGMAALGALFPSIHKIRP